MSVPAFLTAGHLLEWDSVPERLSRGMHVGIADAKAINPRLLQFAVNSAVAIGCDDQLTRIGRL